MQTYIPTYTSLCMCIHIYIYIHMYTCVYTHDVSRPWIQGRAPNKSLGPSCSSCRGDLKHWKPKAGRETDASRAVFELSCFLTTVQKGEAVRILCQGPFNKKTLDTTLEERAVAAAACASVPSNCRAQAKRGKACSKGTAPSAHAAAARFQNSSGGPCDCVLNPAGPLQRRLQTVLVFTVDSASCKRGLSVKESLKLKLSSSSFGRYS